jgi:hypothetical protein
MIGVWYSVRGDRPAHWHERITRSDGTILWAALSRCGISKVVPSMLADKWARLDRDPESPDFDGQWRCAKCCLGKARDNGQRINDKVE